MMVSIIVINHSRHDVQMPGVELYQPSIKRGWPVTEKDLLDEPITVLRARSSHGLRVRLGRFVGIQSGSPVIASPVTATGERFWSKPAVLASVSTSLPQ
jgi:hypothetical protein